MLYNLFCCSVLNICHDICYITCVMLCHMTCSEQNRTEHVIYHVLCYIAYVMLCYITYVILCYITCHGSGVTGQWHMGKRAFPIT